MYKKQFKGTTQRRAHYDRKVIMQGQTRYIALGKVIPETWSYVRITLVKRTDASVEILIEKLLELNNIAPDKTINLTHKPYA